MQVSINVKYPDNISKWQMGFNSAFKGLIASSVYEVVLESSQLQEKYKIHVTNWAKLKLVLNMQDC
jgi:hypothetical protein